MADHGNSPRNSTSFVSFSSIKSSARRLTTSLSPAKQGALFLPPEPESPPRTSFASSSTSSAPSPQTPKNGQIASDSSASSSFSSFSFSFSQSRLQSFCAGSDSASTTSPYILSTAVTPEGPADCGWVLAQSRCNTEEPVLVLSCHDCDAFWKQSPHREWQTFTSNEYITFARFRRLHQLCTYPAGKHTNSEHGVSPDTRNLVQAYLHSGLSKEGVSNHSNTLNRMILLVLKKNIVLKTE